MDVTYRNVVHGAWQQPGRAGRSTRCLRPCPPPAPTARLREVSPGRWASRPAGSSFASPRSSLAGKSHASLLEGPTLCLEKVDPIYFVKEGREVLGLFSVHRKRREVWRPPLALRHHLLPGQNSSSLPSRFDTRLWGSISRQGKVEHSQFTGVSAQLCCVKRWEETLLLPCGASAALATLRAPCFWWAAREVQPLAPSLENNNLLAWGKRSQGRCWQSTAIYVEQPKESRSNSQCPRTFP